MLPLRCFLHYFGIWHLRQQLSVASQNSSSSSCNWIIYTCSAWLCNDDTFAAGSPTYQFRFFWSLWCFMDHQANSIEGQWNWIEIATNHAQCRDSDAKQTMEVCSQEMWNDANHIKDQPGITLHLTHLTFLQSILDSIVCLRHMHYTSNPAGAGVARNWSQKMGSFLGRLGTGWAGCGWMDLCIGKWYNQMWIWVGWSHSGLAIPEQARTTGALFSSTSERALGNQMLRRPNWRILMPGVHTGIRSDHFGSIGFNK